MEKPISLVTLHDSLPSILLICDLLLLVTLGINTTMPVLQMKKLDFRQDMTCQ